MSEYRKRNLFRTANNSAPRRSPLISSMMRATLSAFEKSYTTAEVVGLLRDLLAEQGFSTTPDLGQIKNLGSRARDCFAYHEIMGTMWDRMTKSKDGVTLEDLMKSASVYNAFNEFLES